MKRKKLILKMALAASLVFIVAISGMVLEEIYKDAVRKRMEKRTNDKINELTKEYQEYLNGIASRIAVETVNQNLLSQINSYIFNKNPKTYLYLWMSDMEGGFIFGVPAAEFSRLNKTYDKKRPEIDKVNYYVDRNNFLMETIGENDEPMFIDIEGVPLPEAEVLQFAARRRGAWRDQENPIISLSAPVVGETQQLTGEVFLKVKDTALLHMNYHDYENPFLRQLFSLSEILMACSAFFLWLMIPSWVYIDARQREVKRAFMWALLTVLTFGFAWIIYLISRPTAVTTYLCPECEKELNGTKAFCPYCGYDLSHTFCPQCQYQVKADWQFCPACRCDLTAKPETEEGNQPGTGATGKITGKDTDADMDMPGKPSRDKKDK